MDKNESYRVLEIRIGASEEEIKHAYRQLARKNHPDIAKNNPNAEGIFKKIGNAYETLIKPVEQEVRDSPDDGHKRTFNPMVPARTEGAVVPYIERKVPPPIEDILPPFRDVLAEIVRDAHKGLKEKPWWEKKEEDPYFKPTTTPDELRGRLEESRTPKEGTEQYWENIAKTSRERIKIGDSLLFDIEEILDPAKIGVITINAYGGNVKISYNDEGRIKVKGRGIDNIEGKMYTAANFQGEISIPRGNYAFKIEARMYRSTLKAEIVHPMRLVSLESKLKLAISTEIQILANLTDCNVMTEGLYKLSDGNGLAKLRRELAQRFRKGEEFSVEDQSSISLGHSQFAEYPYILSIVAKGGEITLKCMPSQPKSKSRDVVPYKP